MTDSENTKLIPLTQGKFAIVDADDYEWLMQWKWRYSNGYAARVQDIGRINGKQILKSIIMHRLIMDAPKGLDVDHINHIKHDNRKCNLRLCTRSQNNMNQLKTRGTSKYKGVHWYKAYGKWQAHIAGVPSGTITLGYFDNEEEAALAYNTAAAKYFGEFAKLNIIEPQEDSVSAVTILLADSS